MCSSQKKGAVVCITGKVVLFTRWNQGASRTHSVINRRAVLAQAHYGAPFEALMTGAERNLCGGPLLVGSIVPFLGGFCCSHGRRPLAGHEGVRRGSSPPAPLPSTYFKLFCKRGTSMCQGPLCKCGRQFQDAQPAPDEPSRVGLDEVGTGYGPSGKPFARFFTRWARKMRAGRRRGIFYRSCHSCHP